MRLLILDACVLIDFYEADPEILGLTATSIGTVHVPSVVLDEVQQIRRSAANELGLTIVEPPLALASDAASRAGRVSFEDWTCVLMARESGWTCVTNDTAVRRVCAAEHVPTLLGLEILHQLVNAGALSRSAARKHVNAISSRNRFIATKVVEGFLKKLGP